MRPDPTRYKVWSGRLLKGWTRNGKICAWQLFVFTGFSCNLAPVATQ